MSLKILPNTTFSRQHYKLAWFQSIVNDLNQLLWACRDKEIHVDWASFREWEYAWVLHHASISHKKVLDVGCSLSIWPLLLRSYDNQVTTLDFNFAQRLYAIQRLMGFTDLVNLDGDAADSNFMASLFGQFEVVTCISVLEHVNDPVDILKNLKRCLVPGGVIALTVDFNDHPTPFRQEDPLYEGQFRKYGQVSHFITEESLLHYLEQAGLSLGEYDYSIRERVAEHTLAAAFAYEN